jgi:hypothetical protein
VKTHVACAKKEKKRKREREREREVTLFEFGL